jgi:hypothetical protein
MLVKPTLASITQKHLIVLLRGPQLAALACRISFRYLDYCIGIHIINIMFWANRRGHLLFTICGLNM